MKLTLLVPHLNPRHLFAIALLVPILGCSEGPSRQSPQIRKQTRSEYGVFDGNPSSSAHDGWRSTVTVVMENNTICSGTLVGPIHVLTAAHCLSRSNPAWIRLTDSRNEIVQSIAVVEKFVHEEYHGGLFHDLAVLKLHDSPSTGKHTPARIGKRDPEVGSPILLVGAGYVRDQNYNGLTSATLKVRQVQAKSIWASEPSNRHSACTGDSGGAGYFASNENLILVGVTRSIETDLACASGATQTIFTSVSSYASWIARIVGPSVRFADLP